MKQDGFDRVVARAERAFSKFQRIREGIENLEPDDVLGIKRARVGRVSQVQRKDGQPRDRHIEFNRPVTRSYRLTNAAGATSFHFQHRAISKVTYEMNQGGLPHDGESGLKLVRRSMADVLRSRLPQEAWGEIEIWLGHARFDNFSDLYAPFRPDYLRA